MIRRSQIHINQIFYSDATFLALDPAFIPLDNTSNERPDWSEYWPISRFFAIGSFSEDDYYGFFSPKFAIKTKLSGESVFNFIEQQKSESDLFAFSPYFDGNAFFINIFEQGSFNYPGLNETFKAAVLHFFPNLNFDGMATDSRSNIFCNYFVAKPRFWQAWLRICNSLFEISEANKTLLGKMLNFQINYNGTHSPSKVFVIERVATLLLATDRRWKAAHFNPMELPLSNSPISQFPKDLLILDSLKIAFNETALPHYLLLFGEKRIEMLNLVNSKKP